MCPYGHGETLKTMEIWYIYIYVCIYILYIYVIFPLLFMFLLGRPRAFLFVRPADLVVMAPQQYLWHPFSAEVERACENNVIRVEITITDFMLTVVINGGRFNKNTCWCGCCYQRRKVSIRRLTCVGGWLCTSRHNIWSSHDLWRCSNLTLTGSKYSHIIGSALILLSS